MGCSPEDLLEAMNNRKKWRERESGISVLAARHGDGDDDSCIVTRLQSGLNLQPPDDCLLRCLGNQSLLPLRHGFNKGRSLKFREGSRVRQTPEEGQRTYRPKDNCPKILHDKNHQASSQKFRHKYIYIYIYINIHTYILSSIDRLFRSIRKLFSVARHAGRSKPRSKPIQLYVLLSLRPLGHQADHVG